MKVLFKIALILVAINPCHVFAQGTAFLYQGRLNQNGAAANGNYDLRFSLFSANTNGTQAGSTLTATAVGVTNGLFETTLDFGNQFTGNDRWLDISVRTNGGSTFTNLTPRQPLAPTPYAIAAANVTGSLAASQLTGIVSLAQLPGALVTNGGTFSGNGAGLTGLAASNLSGTISDASLSSNVARLTVPNTAVQATGTPHVSSGFITSADVVNGGSGYVTAPAVTFIAPNGSGAAYLAQVSGGVVTGLVVQSPGSGYTNGVTLIIAPPPSNAYQVFSTLNIFSGANLLTNPANQFNGTFTGDGAGLTNLNGGNLVAGSIASSSLASNSITAAQLAPGAAASNLTASGLSGVASGGMILSSNFTDTNLINAGYVKLSKVDLGDLWDQRTTNGAPGARYLASSVWTGTEMIVWGGAPDINTGGRYNPVANTWSLLPSSGLAGRSYHTAVWTGSEMIIWGGVSAGLALGDGARYSPVSNAWTSVTASGAPPSRSYHTAVWSGTEMVIWGGNNLSGTTYNTGGRYNPSNNTWAAAAITTTSAPIGRSFHTAVWSGTEMIVWGGNNTNDGGRYNPVNNSWAVAAVTTSGAPQGRSSHTAVWTGTEMIVWGGSTNTIYYNDGGRYNPTSNSWTAITGTLAPSARYHHTAVWTGSEMIVWGGVSTNSSAPFNDGARYSPTANSWTTVSTSSGPSARSSHTAVWTGSDMLVWGGSGSVSLNDTFSYKPSLLLYLYQRP